jgi:hypothetical protein
MVHGTFQKSVEPPNRRHRDPCGTQNLRVSASPREIPPPAHLHRWRPRALKRRQGCRIPVRRVRAPGRQAWKAHPNRTLSTPRGSAARRGAETQRLEVEDLQASQARWRPCRWVHATTRGCGGSDLMAPRLRASARDSSTSRFTRQTTPCAHFKGRFPLPEAEPPAEARRRRGWIHHHCNLCVPAGWARLGALPP